MAFDADWVGRTLVSVETAADTRRLLAFAAAVGETAPEHFDDARPGGIAAPSTFCVVPEWHAVRAARESGFAGLSAAEMARVVHAGQDTLFHAPVRPGDRLGTAAMLAEARAIRAGILAVLRLATVRTETGAPVATTWSTFVYRGVGLSGAPRQAEAAPSPPAEPVATLSADAPTVAIPVPRTLAHTYTEGTGIWNPIHTERATALAAGLPDIILHGTATWALAARELGRAHALAPGAVRRLAGRFAAFVLPGTAIRLRHSALEDGSIRFEVLNQTGEKAIERGLFLVSQPSRAVA